MGLSTATQLPVLTRCEFLDTACCLPRLHASVAEYLLTTRFKRREKGHARGSFALKGIRFKVAV